MLKKCIVCAERCREAEARSRRQTTTTLFSVDFLMSANVLASICYSLSICQTVNLFIHLWLHFMLLCISFCLYTSFRVPWPNKYIELQQTLFVCINPDHVECNITDDYGVNFFVIAFPLTKHLLSRS